MRDWFRGFLMTVGALLLVPPSPAGAQNSIVDTVHNLSVSGPGTVKAVSEGQICIFCHAPHRTSGLPPLWNRNFSLSSFSIYQSSTLDASPGQPTGSSKLCLSCHDGTIALGEVVSRSLPITMSGSQTMPPGGSLLGTDLSDDHPISFSYTSALATADTQLVQPGLLPAWIRLDGSGQVQCTSCHDAHHNLYGKFLVQTDEFGQLCTSCHDRHGWSASSHEGSTASVSGLSPHWKYGTVAQNACLTCHQPHGAGGHERLLIYATEEDNCLSCHGGQVATYDILAQINRPVSHDPRTNTGVHDPVETGHGSQPHVECTDCHNPHAAQSPVFGAGYTPIGNTLLKMPGVSSAGAPVLEAQYEYEICLRCHGDDAVPVPNTITRLSDTPNHRLKFSSANQSFHPVFTSSVNPNVPSLLPSIAPGSMIRCTDCHNSDTTRRTGGSGPDGPHGSIYSNLLEKNYDTNDPNSESNFAYALCYKCHDRQSILGDQSFKKHKKHIQGEDTACSVCHDPHGVSSTVGSTSDHTHLINFDLSVVQPSPTNGELKFVDNGTFHGSCTLMCHGKNHVNKHY